MNLSVLRTVYKALRVPQEIRSVQTAAALKSDLIYVLQLALADFHFNI